MSDFYNSKFTGQEIDEKLENALLCTPQTLTDEQKAQVKENLGDTWGGYKLRVTTDTSDTGQQGYITLKVRE